MIHEQGPVPREAPLPHPAAGGSICSQGEPHVWGTAPSTNSPSQKPLSEKHFTQR